MPAAQNQVRKKRNTEQDITPAQVGRKFIRRNDERLRDVPVAYTPEGKRVFAYNDFGVPVCHSKLRDKFDSDGEPIRCRQTALMHNGRCNLHGGRSPGGVMHYKATHLRTSDCLPSHLQGDFNRALTDPDLLSLNHELAMVDLEVKTLKGELGKDVGGPAALVLANLIDKLGEYLEDGTEITEEFLLKIVEASQSKRARQATVQKLNVQYELRRRLADTAHHRERDLKTMIKADQAVALVTALAAGCREAIADLFASIEKKYLIIDRDTLPLIDRQITDSSKISEVVEEIAVSGIDKSFKLDFLSDVSVKLGSLINKARETVEGNPSTQTKERNPLAIIRKAKYMTPSTED